MARKATHRRRDLQAAFSRVAKTVLWPWAVRGPLVLHAWLSSLGH